MLHLTRKCDIHNVFLPSVGGVMASMVAFQAVDPGSTPGRRNFNFLFFGYMPTALKPNRTYTFLKAHKEK